MDLENFKNDNPLAREFGVGHLRFGVIRFVAIGEHNEVPVQVMALSLYKLDFYYKKEIAKGRADLGNFTLRLELRAGYFHLREPSKAVLSSTIN